MVRAFLFCIFGDGFQICPQALIMETWPGLFYFGGTP
jgi:hypothetical protein